MRICVKYGNFDVHVYIYQLTMYGSGGSTNKKQRPTTTSYLVRPKLGALRSLYSNRPLSSPSNEKRKRAKKSTAQPKMEFRRKPDYADTAYREAVGRLRILMAESYTPIRSRVYGARPIRELDSAGEETDNQSMISGGSRNSRLGRSYYSYNYNPITPRKYYYPPLKSSIGALQSENPIIEKPIIPQETSKFESSTSAPPELMSFIERQEDYIEQLEKESRFCKDELSSLLSKVKEVISENEHLHEKQKTKLIRSVFDHLETETETETEIDLGDKSVLKSPKKLRKSRIIEGPSIVFESRISELEAQLTQAKIDLKKAQEDNDSLRKKLSDGSYVDGGNYEAFKRQLDGCNREKEELLTKVKALQSALSTLRDKENDTCDQVKRSLDVAEQAQYEKSAADLEIRRLKDELERQHMKLRDAIADQSRRISDERSAVERRYTQQIEQLTAEVGVQWETTNKLQLELDKQRRENADLRRECAQKQALIDELKKDMQNKILTLQSDIGVTGAEKSALEQQISTLNMANERTDRQYKQEITRLQAEIQSLRQRLDRADADLIHSRRENIRLNEQVASLEKEINLNAAISEERSKSATPRSGEIMALPPPTPKKDDRERELTSMIQDMENKHDEDSPSVSNQRNSPSSQAPSTSTHPEPQNLRRSESRSSLKVKSRLSSRQPSQEKLPLSPSPVPTATFQQSPKPDSSGQHYINNDPNVQQYVTNDPSAQQYSQPQYEADQSQYPPNAQYSAQQYDPNQEYGEQYATDPNQQYAEGADQYQYDPNVQYDPNQQYEQYDPNQTYSEEPDQYVQDQNQYYGEQNQSYADTNPQSRPVDGPTTAKS